MRVECPHVPSGVPAPARCTLVRTTPRAPSTRQHACLLGRPVAWSPVHSLARLPAAHSPPTTRTESVITERTAVLARTDTRVPHTTCPRHGHTLCVSTRIHPCTRSPACLPSIGACSPARKKIEWSCSWGKKGRCLPIIQAPFGTGGSRITALAVRVGSGHKEPSSNPGPNLHQQECPCRDYIVSIRIEFTTRQPADV